MSKNGGFPPIKYKIKNQEKTIDNFNKDRLNAPNINKHLDIKKKNAYVGVAENKPYFWSVLSADIQRFQRHFKLHIKQS